MLQLFCILLRKPVRRTCQAQQRMVWTLRRARPWSQLQGRKLPPLAQAALQKGLLSRTECRQRAQQL